MPPEPPSAEDSRAAFEDHVREQAKAALRQKMRALRASVPADKRRERSESLCARVLELVEVQRAQTVLTFQPIKGEPVLDTLHEALRARGVTLALTRIDPATDTLEVAQFEQDRPLVLGPFGLHEPGPDARAVALEDIDVVLVPGLVMDLRGHRVGYGRGYFDRLLPRLPTAFRCGLCYDFQLVGEAPSLPHDVPLHAVVTDAQLVRPDPSP
ncbi:MAG: 5-formyltetrahydrofolate cyclo-ligase [Polyangiales bacterium]|nr:5-formyltetrahydrofolate cyclo-ligase [Myxococcales bacterium]MCB9660098.1 5-formyltetrahydrofolate cyclo-ligase [Sandaracinaceae bacterium]